MSYLKKPTIESTDKPKKPVFDMCSCSSCGWVGKVSDCESDYEQDGWENPPYIIHLCPKCDDGVIDDYWPKSSNDIKEKYE